MSWFLGGVVVLVFMLVFAPLVLVPTKQKKDILPHWPGLGLDQLTNYY